MRRLSKLSVTSRESGSYLRRGLPTDEAKASVNSNWSKGLAILFLFLTLSVSLFAFSPEKVAFNISINNLKTNLNEISIFVMPGDTIHLQAAGTTADQYVVQPSNGELIEVSRFEWYLVSPKTSGNFQVTVLHNNPPEKMLINVFVKIPVSAQNGEYLNGYRIGSYPKQAFRNLPEYVMPEGFVEVTPENKDMYVSPHFQLKQFLCKQQSDHWPKYILLRPEILIKLEMLLQRLNKNGGNINSLFIMSGYRTPYYNASIGNGRYSRHIYGDAMDVYVDTDGDSVIDDLNKDGTASMKDADVIYNIIDAIDKNPEYKHLVGGLGKYQKTSTHTWDVHLDTRGYRARW